MAESFFSSLVKERSRKRVYKTREWARADVFDDVLAFCNRTRRYSPLGGVSPEAFEQAEAQGWKASRDSGQPRTFRTEKKGLVTPCAAHSEAPRRADMERAGRNCRIGQSRRTIRRNRTGRRSCLWIAARTNAAPTRAQAMSSGETMP
jgi:hypothetical protein